MSGSDSTLTSEPHDPVSVVVDWYDRLEHIEALEPAWRSLEKRVGSRMIFAGPDFVIPWYRHFCGSGWTPLLGTACAGGRLVGLAPLVMWNGSLGKVPLRRVDFAGHQWDAGEFLAEENAPRPAVALLEALAQRRKFDVLCFGGFEPQSRILGELRDAAARVGFPAITKSYAYATVDLRGGFEAYCRSMTNNFRRNLRRHRSKVESAGVPGLDRFLPPQPIGALPEYLERVFRIQERSWKARMGPPSPRHRGFFDESVRRFAERGMIDIGILTIDGEDAAFLVGVVERGVYYDFNISFDSRFENLSPGTYLLHEILRTLPDAGVHTVVSHGDHEYKRRWATGLVPQTRVFFFGSGPRAVLARATRFMLPAAWRSLRRRSARAASKDPGSQRWTRS